MLEILNSVEGWLKENHTVALATVVDTWGSAPRRAGAKMAVNDAMGMSGSVSGGCVETAVVEEALDSLKKRRPRLLTFGVSDDEAWGVGLACGGKISVFVEPLDQQWWQIISDFIQQNRRITTATVISGEMAGQKVLAENGHILYATVGAALGEKLVKLASPHNSTTHARLDDLDVLVDVYRPQPRLIIIGGAHVAIALKDIAHVMGFRVYLIDPRQVFASQERFPDVELISQAYPDKVLPDIGLNSESYVAILTHDPKIDDPALRVALSSDVPYVGILSSKKTHEKRIKRLTDAGLDPHLLERIRVPIGIDIGAQTPEEIALCIMAEIIAVRNGMLL
jgi:xanthine dehydrogenase accessory factor